MLQPDREGKPATTRQLWPDKIGEFDVDSIYLRVLRIVRYLLRSYRLDEADTDDIAIEIMVSLIRNGFRGMRAERIEVYLASVARNRILYGLRRQMRERGALAELQRTERMNVSDSDAVEAALETDDKLKLLEQAMASLSDEQRAILFMRFYENLTIAQIAQRLGKTYSAVAARTFRALQKLRSALLEKEMQ